MNAPPLLDFPRKDVRFFIISRVQKWSFINGGSCKITSTDLIMQYFPDTKKYVSLSPTLTFLYPRVNQGVFMFVISLT